MSQRRLRWKMSDNFIHFLPEMEVSDVDETLKYTDAKTLVYGKNNVAVMTVSCMIIELLHPSVVYCLPFETTTTTACMHDTILSVHVLELAAAVLSKMVLLPGSTPPLPALSPYIMPNNPKKKPTGKKSSCFESINPCCLFVVCCLPTYPSRLLTFERSSSYFDLLLSAAFCC